MNEHNSGSSENVSALTTNVSLELIGMPEWPETRASKVLWVSIGTILIVIALFGHPLSIAASIASRRLRSLPISVCIIANALSGLLAVFTGLLRNVILHWSDDGTVDIRSEPYGSEVGCKAHVHITYFALQYHAWVQAIVAAERVVAVRAPLRYQKWCTRARCTAVALIMAAALFIVNSFVSVLHSHNEYGHCGAHYYDEYHAIAWGYLDMILFSLMPAAVIVPCNVLTVMTLRDPSHRICSSTVASNRSHPITVMLVTVNVIFLFTTLPVSVIFFLNWPADGSRSSARLDLLWGIFNLLQYGGCCSSFFVYCLTSSRFRQSLASIVKRTTSESLASSMPQSSNKLASTAGLRFVNDGRHDSCKQQQQCNTVIRCPQASPIPETADSQVLCD